MSHLTESELAGYLDGDLSPVERRGAEAHLEGCDPCRAELVAAVRLLDQEPDSNAPPAVEEGKGRRWSIPAGLAGLAAAAALAGLLMVGPDDSSHAVAPQQERVNTEGVTRLQVHAPAEESLVSRDDLRFVWAGRGTGAYRITITADDGGMVWSSSVTDTTAVPPASLELDGGERFFWFVDAIDGGVVARTDPHSFIVAP